MDTTATTPSKPTPLRALGPAWFTIVMGIAGLALAWSRAVPVMGTGALGAALVVGAAAVALFVLLAVLSLWRILKYPQAFRADQLHPGRRIFVATVPLATVLVATLLAVLAGPGPLAATLWLLGSAAQFVVTVWLFAAWLDDAPAGGPDSAVLTPALLIPGVANAVPAMGGGLLGFGQLAAAQLAIGGILWLGVTALLLARLRSQGPWPAPQLPLVFIAVAPPAVIGIGLLQLGAPPVLGVALWGVALFFLAWSATQLRRIAQQPFALPFWAMLFPLAAFTSLSLQLAPLAGAAGERLATLLLALASLLALALAAGTLQGLRRGTLLQPLPEPARQA
ncbi:MAG: C4-dicarboxylate ABC transporter [Ramlibacter sp.]